MAVETPGRSTGGAAVLDKYIGGESAAAMTGAEFYALVGHIKRQHGQRGGQQRCGGADEPAGGDAARGAEQVLHAEELPAQHALRDRG